ncbi:hypothetical protein MANES_13G055333v8 [Manihot esculenta]|uniref:Uncharacterized protein n=1 Tax=Manihot esculenta TaxID=3983 RepID=A0ACB7GJH6_MANES|nr:hypothetical protein MANES_13G055333v8 [Manihot esculenta]
MLYLQSLSRTSFLIVPFIFWRILCFLLNLGKQVSFLVGSGNVYDPGSLISKLATWNYSQYHSPESDSDSADFSGPFHTGTSPDCFIHFGFLKSKANALCPKTVCI